MIISLFVPFLPLNSRMLCENYRFIIPTSHDFSTIGVDLIANSSMLKFSHQEDFKCADYFNVDQLCTQYVTYGKEFGDWNLGSHALGLGISGFTTWNFLSFKFFSPKSSHQSQSGGAELKTTCPTSYLGKYHVVHSVRYG